LSFLIGCGQEDIIRGKGSISTRIQIQTAPAADAQRDIIETLSYALLIILQDGQEVPPSPILACIVNNQLAEWKDISLEEEGEYTFVFELFSEDNILRYYGTLEDQTISVENKYLEVDVDSKTRLRLTMDIGESGSISDSDYTIWLPPNGGFAVSVEVEENVQSLFGAIAELEFRDSLVPVLINEGDLLGNVILFLAATPSEFTSFPILDLEEANPPEEQSGIAIGITLRGQRDGVNGPGTLATIIFNPETDGTTNVQFNADRALLKLDNGNRIGKDQLILRNANITIRYFTPDEPIECSK
jgi:hypothetical protein